ncbi:hypothetical protein JYU34_004792 [Plutella xylostella]|uniref:Uncharacterized protein n=1 Tax=Plutella xylostella TaxID=51655 RepID=A0ABQ7QYV7_PLUXY|nr:hypothetical protein JYU34_004792 [Plutella xylostella]
MPLFQVIRTGKRNPPRARAHRWGGRRTAAAAPESLRKHPNKPEHVFITSPSLLRVNSLNMFRKRYSNLLD